MAAQTVIKLVLGYADNTSRAYEIGPLNPTSAAVTNAKTNITTFKNNLASWKNTLVSDGGAQCTGITTAQVITTSDTEINLN